MSAELLESQTCEVDLSSDDEELEEVGEEQDPRGVGKIEELVLHVAQNLHVLINSLISFKDKGRIEIPPRIELKTMKGTEFPMAESRLVMLPTPEIVHSVHMPEQTPFNTMRLPYAYPRDN